MRNRPSSITPEYRQSIISIQMDVVKRENVSFQHKERPNRSHLSFAWLEFQSFSEGLPCFLPEGCSLSPFGLEFTRLPGPTPYFSPYNRCHKKRRSGSWHSNWSALKNSLRFTNRARVNPGGPPHALQIPL